jgi:hypothetical protein
MNKGRLSSLTVSLSSCTRQGSHAVRSPGGYFPVGENRRHSTTSVSELMRAQASMTKGAVMDTVKDVGDKFSDSATDAQNRLRGIGSDIEATIERNPLAAVLTALSAGLLIGMVSGARR